MIFKKNNLHKKALREYYSKSYAGFAKFYNPKAQKKPSEFIILVFLLHINWLIPIKKEHPNVANGWKGA